jgi:hypothetical protein
MQELWKTVETEKVSGYEHRAPKRRIKKNDKNEQLQAQTKLKLNDDGSFSVVSQDDSVTVTGKNVCHSGLFF